jgi:hypothetical protein
LLAQLLTACRKPPMVASYNSPEEQLNRMNKAMTDVLDKTVSALTVS